MAYNIQHADMRENEKNIYIISQLEKEKEKKKRKESHIRRQECEMIGIKERTCCDEQWMFYATNELNCISKTNDDIVAN